MNTLVKKASLPLILVFIFCVITLGCHSGISNAATDQETPTPKSKPNFIVFFVDDLGYYDLGFRNEVLHTPNIDQLASDGLEFSTAYVPSPTCSPSRVGLYTGIHPAKLSFFRHVMGSGPGEFRSYEADPAGLLSRSYLPLEEVTYAEALKELNYNTLFAGKWHIGRGIYTAGNQGFDTVLDDRSGGSTRKHAPVVENGISKEVYVTDMLTDTVVNYIESYDSEEPFLVQLSYWNVHTPIIGRKDLVEFYHQRGLGGIAAEYAAQITAIDESVGRVLSQIEEKGLSENTVVIFTSDQGSYFPNLPLRGSKAVGTAVYEGAAKVPFLIKWPGVTQPGSKKDDHISTLDVFPTLMDIAGADPSNFPRLDGLSLTHLIKKDQPLKREHLVLYRCYDAQYAAVIANDGWKIVAYRGKQFELYNVDTDIAEENDVSAENPEKLAELVAVLREWEKSADLLIED